MKKQYQQRLFEAFSICVTALRWLTSNDNVYADDAENRKISFKELQELLEEEPDTCINCQHWNRWSESAEHGDCERLDDFVAIKSKPWPSAVTKQVANSMGVWLSPPQNFYCNRHEKRG